MSTDALDIHDKHLQYQLGKYGPFTQKGILAPTGSATVLYGIFDDVATMKNKDSGQAYQKFFGRRFIVATAPDIDVYADLDIYMERSASTYRIEYIEKDESGAQVLWLV